MNYFMPIDKKNSKMVCKKFVVKINILRRF